MCVNKVKFAFTGGHTDKRQFVLNLNEAVILFETRVF